MRFHNFPRVAALLQAGIEARQHLGVQGFVQRRGEVLLNDAFGENAPGDDLTPDHVMLWLSSGKPLTAAAILLLADRSEIDLDAPVANVIPEFGAAEKSTITLRQLLTHTAGLKPIVTGWPQKTWEVIVERICAAGLQRDWIPGMRAAYDPARSWFILGEVIHRVTGQPVEDFVRREICEPLQMHNCWMAMTPEKHRQARLGMMYAPNEGELVPTGAHLEQACTHPSPGGSMRGPVAELGRFYAMLLNGGEAANGRQILREATVHEMTKRQREGMFDETFQHRLDFGLGLIVNSNRYGHDTVPYGFGRRSSETAFGHGGAQSSIGFADPERELVVVLVANGSPGEAEHNQRFRSVLNALFEDLD